MVRSGLTIHSMKHRASHQSTGMDELGLPLKEAKWDGCVGNWHFFWEVIRNQGFSSVQDLVHPQAKHSLVINYAILN